MCYGSRLVTSYFDSHSNGTKLKMLSLGLIFYVHRKDVINVNNYIYLPFLAEDYTWQRFNLASTL